MPDADTLHCAICRRPLQAGALYIVRVDVFADPTPEPIDTTAPPAAGEAGIDELLAQMASMTDDELQDGVFRRFEYAVCPACQKLVLKNPLGLPRRVKASAN